MGDWGTNDLRVQAHTIFLKDKGRKIVWYISSLSQHTESERCTCYYIVDLAHPTVWLTLINRSVFLDLQGDYQENKSDVDVLRVCQLA